MSDPEAMEFYCGGINWSLDHRSDPWRCPSVMWEVVDTRRTIHQCAASYDHTTDHVCAEGHRWHQAKPRRSWRDRIRRRQR